MLLKKKDVPLIPNMDDCLHITFDKHQGEETWLVVMRTNENGINIVQHFRNEEAEELYNKLVGL